MNLILLNNEELDNKYVFTKEEINKLDKKEYE